MRACGWLSPALLAADGDVRGWRFVRAATMSDARVGPIFGAATATRGE
jgi:hypothetical protein